MARQVGPMPAPAARKRTTRAMPDTTAECRAATGRMVREIGSDMGGEAITLAN